MGAADVIQGLAGLAGWLARLHITGTVVLILGLVFAGVAARRSVEGAITIRRAALVVLVLVPGSGRERSGCQG